MVSEGRFCRYIGESAGGTMTLTLAASTKYTMTAITNITIIAIAIIGLTDLRIIFVLGIFGLCFIISIPTNVGL